MNTLSKMVITSAKSALLASSLLSIGIIVLRNETIDTFPIIFFLSIIVTFIISSFMILFTIVPIHESSSDLSIEEKFKKYFPFYAMFFFLACSYIVYHQNFESLAILIFGIAYLTAMQAFVWFFKQKTTTS